MIIHNPILTGSFTVNGTDVASITSSAASITAINSYTASQNILNGTYATTGSNTFAGIQTVNSNLVVTGSITAQTLVVQTVTSSVVYSSGSNVFGNNIANTQVITGSVTVTGSLAVVTNGTEFQVTNTGVRIGNISTDVHPITGSVGISGSLSGSSATFSGNLNQNAPIFLDNSNHELASFSNDNLQLFFSSIYNGTNIIAKSSAGGRIVMNLGSFSFQTFGSATTGSAVTPTEKFLIANNGTATFSGSVGIGTSSPATALDVNGSIRLSGTGYVGFGGGNNYIEGDNPNNILKFGTNNVERMRITSGGNVGIGISSPSKLFIVRSLDNNTTTFAGFYALNETQGTEIWYGGIQMGGSNTNVDLNLASKNLGYISFNANSIERMRVYSTGGLNIATSTGDGFCIQFNSGFKLRADSASQMGIVNSGITAYADLRVNNMTKASGTFRISHPLESLSETHDLVHSFIEGPRADLIYRGKVTLINGTATINIDTFTDMTEGTFVALNRDIQCFTTNESGWDLVKGKVEGNILTITSQNTESTDEISWMVVGERQDKHIKDTDWTDSNGKPILEPLKTL
jgi:hypothetical protein